MLPHERPPLAPADLNRINPSIWPRTSSRTDGALTIGGVDVRDLARDHGTPLYVFDEDDVRSRMRDYATAFAGSDVHYAGKAFLCKEVVRWLHDEGLGLDVASGGELAVALSVGFPADAHRAARQQQVGRRAAQGAGGGRRAHRRRLLRGDRPARLASPRRGTRPEVMIRVTTGVEAHTHEYIATAHEDQKFGFSLNGGAAAEAVRRILALPALELVGLHSPHRLADLRHGRLRGGRPPPVDAARCRSRTSTAWSCPSSTSAAATASPTPRRTSPRRQGDRRRRCARSSRRESAPARACRCRGCPSSPAARSSGPAGITLYEVGTVKDGRWRRPRTVRQRRRRHERQHPPRALRRRVHRRAGQSRQRRRARCSRGSSASTARAATSSCATSSCPPTSRRAT